MKEAEEDTIPCVVSDPRLNVSLYERPGRTRITGTTYEPGRGFTGRLNDTSYVCSAARGDEERESQVYYVFSIIGEDIRLRWMDSGHGGYCFWQWVLIFSILRRAWTGLTKRSCLSLRPEQTCIQTVKAVKVRGHYISDMLIRSAKKGKQQHERNKAETDNHV